MRALLLVVALSSSLAACSSLRHPPLMVGAGAPERCERLFDDGRELSIRPVDCR